MHLPEPERVIYDRNPLIDVVCQLRFPPILKISHQEPVEFQDEIRLQYPLFESVQSQIPAEIARAIQQFGVTLPSEQSYNFKSEDQKWQLSITNNLISLTTFDYKRYEDFKQRFKEAINIFEKIYKPSFYTRIGLRYRDLIIRSSLDLKDRDWSELINNCIASELHNPELSASVQSIQKNIIFSVEQGQVNFQHGLVTVKEPEAKNDESAYLFDADFYTEQKLEGTKDVWDKLDQFNNSARKLFRWSITNTLHKAMLPRSVDDI